MARVLIIDDDMITGLVLQEFLKEDGHDVLSIGDESEALHTGADFRPDLLITDFLLSPGVSGVDIARTLLSANQALKIIVISGLPAETLGNELHGFPVAAVLEKPIVAEEVRTLIRHLQGQQSLIHS